MTVSVPVPLFPAASPAVAVQTLVIFNPVRGAVKVPFAKLPPFVQVTVGPVVTAVLSVAVRVDAPVASESTVNVAGLKATTGAVVSPAGGGGGGGGGGTELPPEPPPQDTRARALSVMAVLLTKCFKTTIGSPDYCDVELLVIL